MSKVLLKAVYCLVIAVLVVAGGCSLYGPPVDRSRFVTAKLLPDGQILFTYHKIIYRIAQGVAAFPDGGIPKYVKDISFIGVYDIRSGSHRILKREKNTIWEPGQGPFYIVATKGAMALVSQGGQLRGRSRLDVRHWLCNAASGDVREIDITGELAVRDRDVGEIYLVDDEGTLVFLNNPLDHAREGRNDPRADDAWPEIWVRTPEGEFLKVAETWHYQEFRDGNVIYWLPDTRRFYAFNVKSRTTTELLRYDVPALHDVTEGAGISAQGDRIELGRRLVDKWAYEPLPFVPDF
jgi:hypothetical protein